ncbi:hypothetical protein CDCA_CDCA17G4339 [Cyanidium caldarium]|uniref:Glycosyltransferase 2-like domain-containing protein n=1 Tax=Cyanidium caldarium TaxID=2771 RepID=A0AAV9J186_CYACA|nr:hypothetical protein CDCA_CDCA17G4339 [Cyanidium caldarium]
MPLGQPHHHRPGPATGFLHVVEQRSLREILNLCAVHRRTRIAALPCDRCVTVVLNVYQRPTAFHPLLDAIYAQTTIHTVDRVLVAALGSPYESDFRHLTDAYTRAHQHRLPAPLSLISSDAGYNPGYFGRLLVAAALPTKYVLLLDDDVVLGDRYLELCLALSETLPLNSVLGQRGARYYRARRGRRLQLSPNRYHDYLGDHSLLRRADVLFSSWFLPTAWLRQIFERQPLSWRTAEDMHLSFSLRALHDIPSVALPVDPSLPAYQLDRAPHLGHVNRSWSEGRNGIAALRDRIADHWLAEPALGPTQCALSLWTRKDMLACAMPLRRFQTRVLVRQQVGANSEHRFPLQWTPFACNLLRLHRWAASVACMSTPCAPLVYRRPWIGVAKSYFGEWSGGFYADHVYWGRRASPSYRRHIGYTLCAGSVGGAALSGVLCSTGAAQFRVWDATHRRLLYDIVLQPNRTLHLPAVPLSGPRVCLAVVFTDVADDRDVRHARQVRDELRIAFRPPEAHATDVHRP